MIEIDETVYDKKVSQLLVEMIRCDRPRKYQYDLKTLLVFATALEACLFDKVDKFSNDKFANFSIRTLVNLTEKTVEEYIQDGDKNC